MVGLGFRTQTRLFNSIEAQMSKSSVFENAFLKLVFNATAIANIADNASSSPLTNLYAGLCTDDPGEDGDQETNETDYTGYERVAVARTTGGWTVTDSVVSPAAVITFPACTGGTSNITYFTIGTAASGAGIVLYSGPVTPTLSVSNGITPQLGTGTEIIED